MSKHRKGTNPQAVTVTELGHKPQPKPPTARETFAALAVVIVMLALFTSIGALAIGLV